MQGLGAGQMQHTETEKTEQIHGHHHIACPGLYMLHRVVKTGHGSLPSFLRPINPLVVDF